MLKNNTKMKSDYRKGNKNVCELETFFIHVTFICHPCISSFHILMKHLDRFHSGFGRHLVFMKIPPRKEED